MMNQSLECAQRLFFEAMAKGWVAGARTTTIAELPGSNVFSYGNDEYRVIDCWLTPKHSLSSTGSTTIFRNDQPIWVMHYGGRYEKTAIPFLKSCLLQAYSASRFYGGRGQQFIRDGDHTYVNQMDGDGSFFSNFSGQELIYGADGVPLGHHWYHGMPLI